MRRKKCWSIFLDGSEDSNTDEMWKKGNDLVNGWFTRPTKKSALRLVDKIYREHGIVCFATIHGESRVSHGEKVYKYVHLPYGFN